MLIGINYLSVLSSVTGKKTEFMEIEEYTSISKLMEILVEKYSPRMKDIIYMDSTNRKYLVSFLVNKVMTEDNYELKNNDELSILLALGGG